MVIKFPTREKEFQVNPKEEIDFLLEVILEEYVLPEHKDAGEISDVKRLLRQL